MIDTSGGERTGYLVGYRETQAMFEGPEEERTKEYLRGEFS